MARPKNKDGIRAKARSRDGFFLIHFEEYYGHWIVSPEKDRDKALAWARRNRDRLIQRNELPISEHCKGFYAPDSLWVRRKIEKGHTYSDAHLKAKQAHLTNYFVPEFGTYRPADLDRPDFRREFDNWLLNLKDFQNPTRRLAKATKNKIIYAVNELFEDLVDLKKISRNPIDGIGMYGKEPENPRGVIDRESLARMFPPRHEDLIRIWGSSMWACLMLVFYDTGARPGEVRALTWKEIDASKRFIAFRRGVAAGTQSTLKSTKTGVIKAGFLNTRTIQELDIWRVQSRFPADDGFIFTENGRTPTTNSAAERAFRRGLAQVEKEVPGWKADPKWTPYWLRHSFGTYQMENLTDEEIASLLGNGVAVLKRHYQHPDNETLYKSVLPIQKKLDKVRE
jgi:integrase